MQELSRAITPQDWARDSIVRRRALVTHLIMPCEHWWDVQGAVAVCPPPDALFPNLRHLTIIARSPYDDRGVHPGFLDLILGPNIGATSTSSTITALHLLGVRASHVPDPRGLIARCPALTDIRIDHAPEDIADADDVGFAYAILDAVPKRYRHLTSLSLSLCGDFTSTQLSALSQMRGLRSLALFNSRRPSGAQPRPPPMQLSSNGDEFRSLQALKLFYFYHEDVLAIIHCVRGRALERISLHIRVPSAAAFAALMEAIGAHCDPPTLRVCRMHFIGGNMHELAWGVSRAHLKQLSAFPNLTDVVLEKIPSSELVDEDVAVLVGCWPALRSLVVTTRFRWPDEARLTLNALIAIARHCPDIERVKIRLDALVVPHAALVVPQAALVAPLGKVVVLPKGSMEHSEAGSSSRLGARSPLCMGARPPLCTGTRPPLRLAVDRAPIDDADAVAQILQRLFPGIQDVKYREVFDAPHGWKTHWDRVNALLLAAR